MVGLSAHVTQDTREMVSTALVRICSLLTSPTVHNNICADIDECASGSDMCNSTVSECFNTEGSFKCICRPGFNMNNQDCVCE